MFIQNKYTKWYLSIIDRAKSEKRIKCDQSYYESHHIIPKSMGGTETVLLTAKEHYICHLLLCKMVFGTNKHKMINAMIKMAFCESDNQKRYTSKSFSVVRRLIAEKNSEMFKGKPKSESAKKNMKGRSGTWIRTEEHLKKISYQRQGKNTGNTNPFFGKTHSEETKKQWSERRKGKKTRGTTGMKWYNDGAKNTMKFEYDVDRTIWKYEGKL